jgi:hypothetical protein
MGGRFLGIALLTFSSESPRQLMPQNQGGLGKAAP